MEQKKKNIFIWGTSFLIAAGLKSLLGSTGRFTVIEVTGSWEHLVKSVENRKPDALVIDVAGFEFTAFDIEKLKSLTNLPEVVLLLETISRSEFQMISEAGIQNILLKNGSAGEIINAVESAVSKRKFYSSDIVAMILESIEAKQSEALTNRLTPSEMEIVKLIAGGLTTKEIAARRNVSFHTINTHRKNIFRKLLVSNASELTMKAIKAGWIDNIEYYI